MAGDNAPSSPAFGSFTSVTEELAYYKAQYQTLEEELIEFQQSSKELEAELEKDVDESEKRERKLQEKVESLGFEVEEWKTKYKQSRTETNSAQNTLQKEITTLRDSQRTLQLKLRDIEVQNDDFERQARHTTSSLEDLESKYNVAIERTVLLDEEIKIGEQERESLRIENQRLRDELSDLRIEAEIVQEKLRIAEQTIEGLHQRKMSHLLTGGARPPRGSPAAPRGSPAPRSSPAPRGGPRNSPRVRPRSPASDTATSRSSPTTTNRSTPPRMRSGLRTVDSTPPSPPLSESSLTAKPVPATPMPARKPSVSVSSAKRPPANRTPSSMRTPASTKAPAPTKAPGSTKTPDSTKTPKPTAFPYKSVHRGSSYTSSSKPGTMGRTTPSLRSTAPISKAPRQSTGGNAAAGGPPRSGSLYQIRGLIGKMQKLEERVHSARSKLPAPQGTPPRGSPRNGSAAGNHMPSNVTLRSSRKRVSGSTASSMNAPRVSGVSRLSFGVSASGGTGSSRPSSRASMSSQSGVQRPESRSSTRTPMGHYASSSVSGVEGRLHRPRSSMSGSSAGYSHASHAHSRSISVSMPRSKADSEADDASDNSYVITPTARRMSMSKTGIPTPSALPLPRRQSGSRKVSLGTDGEMGPPARPRKMSEIGETY